MEGGGTVRSAAAFSALPQHRPRIVSATTFPGQSPLRPFTLGLNCPTGAISAGPSPAREASPFPTAGSRGPTGVPGVVLLRPPQRESASRARCGASPCGRPLVCWSGPAEMSGGEHLRRLPHDQEGVGGGSKIAEHACRVEHVFESPAIGTVRRSVGCSRQGCRRRIKRRDERERQVWRGQEKRCGTLVPGRGGASIPGAAFHREF
jgi:hypothetical protein